MPQDEVAAWKARDPIARCRARLLADGIRDEAGLADLERGVEQEVQAAMQFAIDSPLPAVGDMFSGLYVEREVIR